MLPKGKRVSTSEFPLVLKGKSFHSTFLSLSFLKGGKTKISVVASKKVSKKSPIRNKNKRRVRHIIKKLEKSLILGSYIFFIKKDLTKVEFSSLEEEVKNITSRVI